MQNSTIALDIVMLPPPAVTNVAKAYNAKLLKQYPLGLRLDETHLAHITLMQLYAKSQTLPEIIGKIAHIAEQFSATPLRANGIASLPLERFFAFYLTLDKQPELLRLHEMIMNALQGHETEKSDSAFLLDPGETLQPSTIAWTKRFRQQASYQHFDPHITVGLGQELDFVEPIAFLADRLAICHLGNHNTCRKILWEIRLNSRAPKNGKV